MKNFAFNYKPTCSWCHLYSNKDGMFSLPLGETNTVHEKFSNTSVNDDALTILRSICHLLRWQMYDEYT